MLIYVIYRDMLNAAQGRITLIIAGGCRCENFSPYRNFSAGAISIMTMGPREYEPLRLEYYSSRLFTMQDIRGKSENYNDLRHTYQISIIGDWAMFRDQEF
ncbi:MAG: hypothetical protein LBL79_14300 [Prevotella sp.]|jgi:hypothetical protein|nr:hypothetical protein [Prevotella sp.]